MSGRILVTGATGMIGGQVVRRLRSRGADVLALTRKADETVGGTPTVVGDLADRRSMIEAMRDVDAMLLITPPVPQQLEMGETALAAAAETGVGRIVHVSTSDASVDSPVPWASAPARLDDQLRDGGADWTILKPSAYDGDLLAAPGLLQRGLIMQCSGGGKVAWIDPADVAACATTVLTTDGFERTEHVLTGPQSLSYGEVADVMTEVRGSKVRFLNLPGPLLKVLLRASGTSAWQADGLVAQFGDVIRNGRTDGAAVTDGVERILGRRPRPLADYLRENL